MKIKQIILLLIILIIATITCNSELIYPGEKIKYRVSYLGITLGYITIITEGQEELNGIKVIKTKSFMKSNPKIPFIDLQAVYNSWIDPSVSHTHKFIGQVKLSDDSWDYHLINCNYSKQIISSRKWIRKKKFFDKSFHTKKKYNDGLSLFFFARRFIKSGKSIRIPTIVDRDTVFTIINFQNKIVNTEIDAVGYSIRTIYFNGKADWTGIYGITGEFQGWFSDDDASIPIKAKMKVYIGNIDIELIKWKHGNWKPPRAKH